MKSKGAAMLRDWRERNGTSQRWVADELGVRPQSISDYERGVHRPTRSVATTIERKFGIPSAAWDEAAETVEAAA